MSFHKIQLPASVIASLYKDSLISLEEPDNTLITSVAEPEEKVEDPVVTSSTLSEKKYLGDNKKGIVILVEDTNAVYLEDNSLALLTQILGACKLNLGDVAIINAKNTAYNVKEINKEITTNVVI